MKEKKIIIEVDEKDLKFFTKEDIDFIRFMVAGLIKQNKILNKQKGGQKKHGNIK